MGRCWDEFGQSRVPGDDSHLGVSQSTSARGSLRLHSRFLAWAEAAELGRLKTVRYSFRVQPAPVSFRPLGQPNA